MYKELIGERGLCVCFVLRMHCTFDGDGRFEIAKPKLFILCFFYHREQNAFFKCFPYVLGTYSITSSIQNIIF